MSTNQIIQYQNQFHQDPRILHVNNAGLAPISLPARNKIFYWAERFYKEGFNTDQDYMEDVLRARFLLAQLVGCDPFEVAFFQNTSSAISQLCLNFPLQKGDQVISWDQEYGSNLYPWREACHRSGAEMILVESEANLTTPVHKLIEKITENTKVIAISWVQFISGAQTDLQALSKITREMDIFLFVDVIQGLGLHPFHMKNWGIDAVAGGSYKWLTSPVGLGFLAVDQKHIKLIRPHNIGATTFGTCDDATSSTCEPKMDARKFESGSKQVLEITALGASLELILKTTVSEIEKQVLKLSKRLALGLREQGFQVFYNDSSIVNFIPRAKSEESLQQISCQFARRGPGIRLSPHAFNSESEIDKIIEALARV